VGRHSAEDDWPPRVAPPAGGFDDSRIQAARAVVKAPTAVLAAVPPEPAPDGELPPVPIRRRPSRAAILLLSVLASIAAGAGAWSLIDTHTPTDRPVTPIGTAEPPSDLGTGTGPGTGAPAVRAPASAPASTGATAAPKAPRTPRVAGPRRPTEPPGRKEQHPRKPPQDSQ